MITLAELVETLSKNPEFKAMYKRQKPIFDIVSGLIVARRNAGLTQRQVASRMNTSQSVVSRIESAKLIPTYETLHRYAEACGMRIEMQLRPAR